VTEGWRKFLNEELRNLHFDTVVSCWGCDTHVLEGGRGDENAFRTVVGNQNEERQLERPSHRWEGKNKTDFK
jgi:hypothetical protein